MTTEHKVRLSLLALLAAGVVALSYLDGGKDAGETPSADTGTSAEVIDFKFLDQTLVDPAATTKVSYPPELAALDNRRVSIVGFMAPFEEIDNMQRFMLLPSYVGCFFCSPPSFTQVLLVEQRKKSQGKLPFVNDAINVTGTLRLYSKESQHPAHKAEFVFALDDAVVEVATGANVPVRVNTQPRKPIASDPLAQAPPAGATPHKAFQPQFLLPAVSDLRKLPMLRAIKFSPVAPEEIERLISEHVRQQHSPEDWKARERAFIALGFADAPFDLPRTLAGLALRRSAGFFDPKTDTIFYNQTRQFSKPESRLEMVRLITEALLAQNVELGKALDAKDDDAVLAATTLLVGDIVRTSKIYDQRTRLVSGSTSNLSNPYPGYPAPPAAIEQLFEFPYQAGLPFIEHAYPLDQLEKLNDAYAAPPRTTAQVFHPELFSDPKRFTASPVTWADERFQNNQPLHSGTLGEAGLAAWLIRNPPAKDRASGWRGDRFAVWDGGKEGDTAFMETHWADEASADAFETAARAQGRPCRVLRGKDRTRVFIIKAAIDERAEALIRQFVQP